MAHRHTCGAGVWVQAPNPSRPSSLLGWHLERLHLVSIHHLTASAVLRVELKSFHRAVRYGDLDFQMPCNRSKTFPHFTGYALTHPADLALIHAQQIQKSIDFNHVYMELHPFTNGIMD